MLCYVDINHVLCSPLQDTLLLKSVEEGDLEGVRDSLTKQANINIANEVYCAWPPYNTKTVKTV